MKHSLILALFFGLAAPAAAQYPSGEGPPDEAEASESDGNEVHDREARSLYAAGTAAFQDGRFEDALARWTEAHELSGRPELLYNIATALDRLGRMDEAVEKYNAFLEQSPDASNANYVRRRIEVIESLDDGEDAGEGPEPEPEPIPEEETEAEPEEGAEVLTAEPPSRIGPAVLFGVAGAAAVTALVTGLLANGQYGDLEDACPEGRCPAELESDGDRLRTLTVTTDVMIGVAGAAAIGGLIWWLVSGGESDDGPAVACGLRGCSARLRF